MAACSGSRSEVSIADSGGVGALLDGAGGGGLDIEKDARASQAPISSSSLSPV